MVSLYEPQAARSEMIRSLHRYWLAKAGERAMPPRADIDPSDIKSILPNLVIAEIEHAPFRVKYRLVGTTIVCYSKLDFTGMYRDEMAVNADGDFDAIYRRMVQSRRPVCGRDLLRLREGSARPYEFALLPLSDDGETVNRCLGIDDYESFGLLNPREVLPDQRIAEVAAARPLSPVPALSLSFLAAQNWLRFPAKLRAGL